MRSRDSETDAVFVEHSSHGDSRNASSSSLSSSTSSPFERALPPVKRWWLTEPQPRPPKAVRDAALLLALADAPLAVLAFSVLRSPGLALSCAIRGFTHTARVHAPDAAPGGATGWTVAGFLPPLLLNLALWRRARKLRGRGVMQFIALLLGPAQLAAWALSNPESLIGVGVRACYLIATSLLAMAARKLRLEGSAVWRKPAFPHSAAAIGAKWIGAQLGADVRSVEVLPLSAGAESGSSVDKVQGFIGETVRVVPTYADPAQASRHGLPRSIVAKLPSRDPLTCLRLRTISLYMRECDFYASAAPQLRAADASGRFSGPALRVPRCAAAAYDDRCGDFCLLLEDAAPLVPGDETAGGSWPLACSVAVRYARLHAVHWRSDLGTLDAEAALGWTRCYDWMNLNPLVVDDIVLNALPRMMADPRLARHVPPSAQRAFRALADHLPLLLAELKEGPMTLIHADCRVENMLLPKSLAESNAAGVPCDPEAALDESLDAGSDGSATHWLSVDWQTCTKGKGIYDLAYFVTLDLDVAPARDATRADRTLVEAYHAALAQALQAMQPGAAPLEEMYPLEQCWRDYRLSALLATLIPIAVMQPESIGVEGLERQHCVREAMLRRAAKAVDRLRCGDLLEEVVAAHMPPKAMGGALCTYRTVEERLLSKAEEEHEKDEAPVMIRSATPQDERLAHISPAALLRLTPGKAPPPGRGRRDAYDRWFLNGYDQAGRFFFAAALGVYPGRRVVDASFSVVVDGVQHNVRASRRLSEAEWPRSVSTTSTASTTRVQTCVGPIEIEVLEPLQRVRLSVNVPGTLRATLTMTARFPPVMEPPYEQTIPRVGDMHYDRLTQLASWQGELHVPHSDTETLGLKKLAVQDWWGVRDRSWGRRPHGHADRPRLANLAQNALVGSRLTSPGVNAILGAGGGKRCPQFYWFWTPINVTDGGFAYHSHQLRDGAVDNGAAHVLGDPFGLEQSSRGGGSSASASQERTSSSSSSSEWTHGAEKNDGFSSALRSGARALAMASGGKKHVQQKQQQQQRPQDWVEQVPYGKVEAAGHSVLYQPGTRHASKSTLVMTLQDGRRVTITCDPIFPFFMSGVGYNHPTFGHGQEHAQDLVVHVDRIQTELADRRHPLHWHVQEVSRVTAELYAKDAGRDDPPLATASGIAAVEQLIVGPHTPSGFHALCDA